MVAPLLAGAFEAFSGDKSRLAVVENEGSWTWEEFVEEIGRTGKALEGSADNDPVGILLPSGNSFLRIFLAAATVGRPACTFHPDWADAELAAAIEDAGVSTVFTDRTYLPAKAALSTPDIPKSPPGTDDPTAASEPAVFVEDPHFYIGFTSGTSGRPKPFVRRQKSWSSSFEPAGELFSIKAGDMVFLPGSMQHSHFLFGAVLGLNRGATLRLFDHFDASHLANQLRGSSRGVLYLVPTMLLDLDELGLDPFEGVHSVLVSGAKMETHHWEIMERLFPKALVGEFYGASELSFVTVNTSGEANSDPGYVGQPFPDVEIEIRPTADADVDEPGLVYVRSPYLFDGYLDQSTTNSPIGDDGFMTVGDLGRLGPNGLSLVGRASNLIITGGKNVHPEEVEAQLINHPTVAECVVAGVAHPRWGEEIVAFVSIREGSEPTASDFKRHLKERIASYKVPKRWFLVDQIPRTVAGKTDRSEERLFENAIEL